MTCWEFARPSGRLLVPADDVAQNGNPVVVLSFNYWKSGFGSDPGVVNQVLYINGHPFTIVGVADPNFHSVIAGYTPKLFVPMTTKAIVTPGLNDLEDRRASWANIVARLKPGVSRQQAEAAMTPLWRSIRAGELPQIKNVTDLFRKHFLRNPNCNWSMKAVASHHCANRFRPPCSSLWGWWAWCW